MGIAHIVLTVNDALETEKFYTKIFGAADFANPYVAMYRVGATLIIFMQKGTANPEQKFNPAVIGLEHFAFGLKDLADLQQVENVLNENQIQHSGIHIDKDSGKEKIWLNDPSNIRIEFYL